MSAEPTPVPIADDEALLARAALRREILGPEELANALARVRRLRGEGRRTRLEDALEGDDIPTLELKALRRALKPSRRRPVIRGYRILSVAGRGALGTVYRARQLSLGRVVALKALPKVLVQSRKDVDRFLREARLSSTLSHPSIVGVYEVGATRSLYYLSMEFVPGETLAARVRRSGVLPSGRALALAREVAAGLVHAHERGVIHRDLKPGNIMLRPDGPVKIVDFGLARGITPVPAERITELGVLVGTPEFMAPEQARDPASVDGRADVYSLGACLHFALSGRPPVEGGSTLEVLARLFQGEVVPLEEIRPDLPEGIPAWVRKAMAFDPAHRFPDARTALDALVDLVRTLPESERSWHEKFDDTRVSDRNPVPEEPLPARWRRVAVLAAVAGAGLLVGAGALAWVLRATSGGSGPAPAAAPAPAEEVVSIAVERDARALELFEEAARYRDEHPGDAAGALKRFEDVVRRFPETLAAFRARDAAEALRGRGEAGGE